MSKKKAEAPKPPPIIGRIGTNLKVGIVGLPNVGKSTFFNVLTQSSVPAENFPFCTINPSESRVPVPDERYDFLCEHHQPASRVSAFLNVVDIAGLVKGASEGEGLGNAFLSHIRGVDAIFHMVRAFESEDVTHVEGDVNPVRDIKIIMEELRLKDEEYVLKNVDQLDRAVVRGGDKKRNLELECMTKVKQIVVDQKKWVRFSEWNDKEIDVLNQHLLITSKPCIYLVNLSPKDYMRQKNKHLRSIKEFIDANDPGAIIIPFSAEFELDWLEKSPEDRAEFSKNNDGAKSGLPRIIVNGYRALQLQYFFTCGKDEVKAWTVAKGSKAPQAAGRIHSDMEKGFIMAEVMNYIHFKEAGSEVGVKAAGNYKQRGREYVVEDGDIIFFRFNAGAGLTAAAKKK